MTTTESILADLYREWQEHQDAGRLPEVQRVEQEALAHRTLARLRAELAAYREADNLAGAGRVKVQISYWRRRVTVDVDQPAEPAGPVATTAAVVDAPGPELDQPAGGGTQVKAPRGR